MGHGPLPRITSNAGTAPDANSPPSPGSPAEELSRRLDGGSTNTCIDQIFLSCEDLLAARMICGAGGGGFLQAILKKGCTKEQLRERIHSVFQDSGVDVWDCALV